MGKFEKLIEQILSGQSDNNIRFEDLRGLLLGLGFTERIKGGHHNFRKQGIGEAANLSVTAAKQKFIKSSK